MSRSAQFVDLVDQRIRAFVDDQANRLGALGPDAADFVSILGPVLAGGKRFRARFAYWGARAVNDSGFDEQNDSSFTCILDAAAALELFHAAALIHDDIMDSSDTRRGRPSLHREFEATHRARSFEGDAGAFGRSSALLSGDLLLSWSDELLETGLSTLVSRHAATQARIEFNLMRTEVTVGQYLDVFEEFGGSGSDDSHSRVRSERVALYKSAKYSVEAPLRIGAAIGSGTPQDLEVLSAFGRPVGLAFQYRDDLLGVFGDAARTGKPAGDDVREGKRTVLIAMALARLTTARRSDLEHVLGKRDASPQEITDAQSLILESGAVEELESVIARHVSDARLALQRSTLSAVAIAELDRLAESVSNRDS